MAAQCGFDFTGFNAHATDFHLIVVAAQVFDVAVRAPACEVAGAVHPRVWLVAEWIVEKALGSQLRTVEVTPRHPGATDVQLTGHTNRHRTLSVIQQIGRGIAHGFADVQRPTRFDSARGGDHGGLGRAIVVDHRERLLAIELAQAITADQQRAQGRVFKVAAEGVFGNRRWQEAHVQRLRTPPVEQRVDVFSPVAGRRQVQGRAGTQRGPDFPGHGVETEAGEARGVATGAQIEG